MNPRHSVKRRRSSWLLAMDPLAVVEEKLGSVDGWHSSVIMDMFCEKPKVRVSRRVAEFMYGNGVSVSDAAKS